MLENWCRLELSSRKHNIELAKTYPPNAIITSDLSFDTEQINGWLQEAKRVHKVFLQFFAKENLKLNTSINSYYKREFSLG